MDRINKFRAWEKPMSEEWCRKRGISFVSDFKGQMLEMPLNNYFGLSRFFGFLNDEQHILMAFTGLHDKHKIEAYEGDIAKQKRFMQTGDQSEFITGEISISPTQGVKIGPHALGPYPFEIIGSIHQSPELIKGGG